MFLLKRISAFGRSELSALLAAVRKLRAAS